MRPSRIRSFLDHFRGWGEKAIHEHQNPRFEGKVVEVGLLISGNRDYLDKDLLATRIAGQHQRGLHRSRAARESRGHQGIQRLLMPRCCRSKASTRDIEPSPQHRPGSFIDGNDIALII